MAESQAFATLFAFMSTSAGPPRGTPSRRREKSSLRDDDGRLVRGRKSRERIREAAGELFRENGFDGATLREIAKRAGMGASSIYRHVQSKEELLIDELDAIQEESWRRFREKDDRARPTRQRIHHFLRVQHELLLADRDLTMIALRATTKPEARVAKRSLVLNDRTIGLLAESACGPLHRYGKAPNAGVPMQRATSRRPRSGHCRRSLSGRPPCRRERLE